MCLALVGLGGVAHGGGLPSREPSRAELLARVVHWGCQYQQIDVGRIAASELDMIVIDHTLDGRAPTAEDMTALKTKPDGGRRLVVGYLSIGEAESYRPYFAEAAREGPPVWLGSENPNWPGSFSTRYWLPEWRSVLFGAASAILDRMIADGYDGVFLDRVDAYGDWADRATARLDMVGLVQGLAEHARRLQPGFLVIGQNAEHLLDNLDYVAVLDAVSKESLLYGLAQAGVANSASDTEWSLAYLRRAQAGGLKVLAIEYLSEPDAVAKARAQLAGLGFTPFFGTRLLDRLPGAP